MSAPGQSQKNGMAKRRNRTLLDMVMSMMSYASLSNLFLGYTLKTEQYILNLVLSKVALLPRWSSRLGQSLVWVMFEFEVVQHMC